MREGVKKDMKSGAFVFLCIVIFIVTFVASIVIKISYKSPEIKKYSVQWSDEIGTVQTDLIYGEKPANKFDLYLPADNSKESYGLVVYLHAGGFTSGDKTDDREILQWLCSKGYVAAGINYTLRDDAHPEANVLSQSNEIKASIPIVAEEANKYGYNIDRMAAAGGSAGGCLALIYAYRDASSSPIPVKMAFEGVGPTSFYPEDWKCYGFDQNKNAAAAMFSVMTGKDINPEMFGTAEYDALVKDTSALLWVDENTVPTVMAYGLHDKFQPYEASVRLDKALKENGVPHEYIVLPHSGHGLQNDNKLYAEYMAKVEEYLHKYMGK
ncbi:alpha/beta hydrolase [Qiania dongpingensis]|uniref:Alpha/beta hydrolase n=1 Tax=Qiania dongpingensis TaxID=2763669 RepID=A0A7G9G775_9FIRM|nr:alpha/beta hydrolase [Qiania dongpingensis]QNM06657.1 alpha/beta hydrolase [Qiania dongpingensis]